MKIGYARVCESKRRARKKTPKFNLLWIHGSTTTLADCTMLTVFSGIVKFERSVIPIRSEDRRPAAQARKGPSTDRPDCAWPNAFSLAISLTKRDNLTEKSPGPSIGMAKRSIVASTKRDLMTVHRILSHARSFDAHRTILPVRSV